MNFHIFYLFFIALSMYIVYHFFFGDIGINGLIRYKKNRDARYSGFFGIIPDSSDFIME